jgi:hypothetical protein
MPQIPGSALSPLNRFNAAADRGLGKLGGALFAVPQEVASQMDPQTVAMLQKQALLQMGLGMLAARDKGLGAGALAGLNQAQQVMGQGLGQAYVAQRGKREDERLTMQDQRTKAMEERQARLDQMTVEDRQGDVAYRASQDEYRRERDKVEDAYRRQQTAAMAAERAADNARADAALRLQEEAAAQRLVTSTGQKPRPVESATKLAAMDEGLKAAGEVRSSLFGEDVTPQKRNQLLVQATANLPKTQGRELRQKMKFAIEGGLRAMTGAAAPESEVARYMEMFMPAVLDSDDGRKAKLDRFDAWIGKARAMAGGTSQADVPTQGGQLEVGHTEGGFRYRGGDPGLESSWEPAQ